MPELRRNQRDTPRRLPAAKGLPYTPENLKHKFKDAVRAAGLPDDLASQIRARQQQLPRILELGLRELNADRPDRF